MSRRCSTRPGFWSLVVFSATVAAVGITHAEGSNAPGTQARSGAPTDEVALPNAPALTPPRGSPSASPQVRAKQHFEHGRRAYAAQRYGEAAWHFTQADTLHPGPELVFNAALAYDKLKDTSAALRHYRAYLERAPEGARALLVHQRVEVLQRVLAARGVQLLIVRTRPSGALLEINGMLAGVTPWSGELPPGDHTVRLTRAGYAAESLKIDLDAERAMTLEQVLRRRLPSAVTGRTRGAAAAQRVSSTANEEPPRAAVPLEPASGQSSAVRDAASAPAASPLRPWAWATLAAAGAAGATAGGFEWARTRAERDARAATEPQQWTRHVERMERRQRAARISLGVAGGALITSGLLWWLTLSHDEPETPPIVACGLTGCQSTWLF